MTRLLIKILIYKDDLRLTVDAKGYNPVFPDNWEKLRNRSNSQKLG
jgi:hypothetical protein